MPSDRIMTGSLKVQKKDLRLTWKLLNEAINERKSKSPLPSSFNSEDRTITDPVEIANRVCKYFTNIGPSLATTTQLAP